MINISQLSCFLNFSILSLLFANFLQALYVNLGCLKCISGTYYLLLIKTCKLLHSYISCIDMLIPLKKKESLLKEFYLKIFSSLINFLFFFHYHTLYILIKALLFRFLSLQYFGFLISAFFLHFKQSDNIVL